MKNENWKYEITAAGFTWRAADEISAAKIRSQNSWTRTQVWDMDGNEVKDFDARLAEALEGR